MKKTITNNALLSLLRIIDIEKVTTLVKHDKPFAFCFGIRRQRIYISTRLVSLMTKKELEAILWHEKYHLDNHDSIISFVARAGAFIFPLFPLFSDLLNQYKLEREIRADTNALQKVGSKKVILTAFRKLIESPSYSLLLGQSFADATLEERIKTLLQIKLSRKNIKKRNLFISFVSIIALITALAAPVHAFEVHSRKQDAMMVCLQGGTCATWCEEHNTIIPYSQNTSHEEILSRPYSPAF